MIIDWVKNFRKDWVKI